MFPGKRAWFLCVFSALLCGLIISSSGVKSQPVIRHALFLGNSYTYVNDLPLLTAGIAHSAGDSLIQDSYSPGGYTLGWQPTAHVADPVSLAKISSQNWDFVIIQEQSQTPAIHRLRDSCMFPAAAVLHDSVRSANPCARVLFYLTWGRRFGGMQCFTSNYCSAPFTGFNQMQDTVTVAYKTIADSLGDWIAPVGEAWRLAINTSGMVLHSSDDSHPNLKGSYLAACVFYSAMFGKPTTGLTFYAGLAPDTALMLQQAADSITLGFSALWNFNNDVPQAAFETDISADTLYTQNLCSGASQWYWDFGDGQTSAQFEPVHVYSAAGKFNVRLKACNTCFCDSVFREISIILTAAPDPVQRTGTISLTGSDQTGMLTFRNYDGNGYLFLNDIHGRLYQSLPVAEGKSFLKRKIRGLYIWRLFDYRSALIATGKILR